MESKDTATRAALSQVGRVLHFWSLQAVVEKNSTRPLRALVERAHRVLDGRLRHEPLPAELRFHVPGAYPLVFWDNEPSDHMKALGQEWLRSAGLPMSTSTVAEVAPLVAEWRASVTGLGMLVVRVKAGDEAVAFARLLVVKDLVGKDATGKKRTLNEVTELRFEADDEAPPGPVVLDVDLLSYFPRLTALEARTGLAGSLLRDARRPLVWSENLLQQDPELLTVSPQVFRRETKKEGDVDEKEAARQRTLFVTAAYTEQLGNNVIQSWLLAGQDLSWVEEVHFEARRRPCWSLFELPKLRRLSGDIDWSGWEATLAPEVLQELRQPVVSLEHVPLGAFAELYFFAPGARVEMDDAQFVHIDLGDERVLRPRKALRRVVRSFRESGWGERLRRLVAGQGCGRLEMPPMLEVLQLPMLEQLHVPGGGVPSELLRQRLAHDSFYHRLNPNLLEYCCPMPPLLRKRGWAEHAFASRGLMLTRSVAMSSVSLEQALSSKYADGYFDWVSEIHVISEKLCLPRNFGRFRNLKVLVMHPASRVMVPRWPISAGGLVNQQVHLCPDLLNVAGIREVRNGAVRGDDLAKLLSFLPPSPTYGAYELEEGNCLYLDGSETDVMHFLWYYSEHLPVRCQVFFPSGHGKMVARLPEALLLNIHEIWAVHGRFSKKVFEKLGMEAEARTEYSPIAFQKLYNGLAKIARDLPRNNYDYIHNAPSLEEACRVLQNLWRDALGVTMVRNCKSQIEPHCGEAWAVVIFTLGKAVMELQGAEESRDSWNRFVFLCNAMMDADFEPYVLREIALLMRAVWRFLSDEQQSFLDSLFTEPDPNKPKEPHARVPKGSTRQEKQIEKDAEERKKMEDKKMEAKKKKADKKNEDKKGEQLTEIGNRREKKAFLQRENEAILQLKGVLRDLHRARTQHESMRKTENARRTAMLAEENKLAKRKKKAEKRAVKKGSEAEESERQKKLQEEQEQQRRAAEEQQRQLEELAAAAAAAEEAAREQQAKRKAEADKVLECGKCRLQLGKDKFTAKMWRAKEERRCKDCTKAEEDASEVEQRLRDEDARREEEVKAERRRKAKEESDRLVEQQRQVKEKEARMREEEVRQVLEKQRKELEEKKAEQERLAKEEAREKELREAEKKERAEEARRKKDEKKAAAAAAAAGGKGKEEADGGETAKAAAAPAVVAAGGDSPAPAVKRGPVVAPPDDAELDRQREERSRQRLGEMLSEVKLETYVKVFADVGCTTVKQFSVMTEGEFDRLGVKKFHQKKLLDVQRSIKALRLDEERQRFCVEEGMVPLLSDLLPDCGVAASQHVRPTMEDEHRVLRLTQSIAYFAIFDGHGGRNVATQCKDHMHAALREELPSNIKRGGGVAAFSDVEDALRRAFQRVDEDVATREEGSSAHCGATVGVVLLRLEAAGRRAVHVANCGDVRAVLCRGNQAVRLSVDHKADDEGERQRVERAGGHVVGRRVQGVLAVSRAIGDHALRPWVINEPYVQSLTLQDRDSHLVLACDGLWDVMSDQDVCDAIRDMPEDTSCLSISKHLVVRAIALRSTDNITVVVMRLK